MGSVWEARHETLPRRFAVKLLRPELTDRPEFLERFKREAVAAAAIDHPNVIYITDFGQTESGSLYIVMEYLEGIGLNELIQRKGRLPLERALPVLLQVADALAAAHACDVIHRDMKPENILLVDKHGRTDVVKLLDFGIARLATAEYAGQALTSEGRVIGTAEYMAPEQALGQTCDKRADIYAFGCLAQELITGNPPFVGLPGVVMAQHVHDPVAPPSSRLRDQLLPPELDALVLRCLAKPREERYQNATELRRDVLKVQTLLFGSSPSSSGRRGDLPAKRDVPAAVRPDRLRADDVGMEQRRQAYHDLLRELAMAAIRSDNADPRVSQALDQALAGEQEAATLTGSIALARQDLARLNHDHARVETQLRHAITDLRMEQREVEQEHARGGEAAALLSTRVADLAYQIDELAKRLDEQTSQHAAESRGILERISQMRAKRRDAEATAAASMQQLASLLERWRAEATTREDYTAELFRQLDEARASWQRAVGFSSTRPT
jgi:hypothetical protein